MSKIEAVIFDVGGVLHESIFTIDHTFVHDLGLSEDALTEVWGTHLSSLGIGEIEESEFWRRMQADYDIRPVAVEEDLLGKPFAEALNPYLPVAQLAQELSLHGVRRAVLSNTIEAHARVLREAGIYDGFDSVVLSHEVGMRKPDPAIYQHTLGLLDIDPTVAVFVDDRSENVDTAVALGMAGVVFDDVEQGVAQIRSLVFGAQS